MSHLLKRRCAAVYCRGAGSDGELRMFQFPRGSTDSQRERYDIWADVAENSELKITRVRAYLCEKHFTKRQFTDARKSRLLRGTDPSRAAWLTSSASADTSISEDPLRIEPYPDEEILVKTKQRIGEDPLRNESSSDEAPVTINFESSENILRVEFLENADISLKMDKEPSEDQLRVELFENEDISVHIKEELSEDSLN